MDKIILLSASVFMLLTSCTESIISSNEENTEINKVEIYLSPEELASISYDNPQEIPESIMFEMIEEFIKANPENAETRSVNDMCFNIESKGYVARTAVAAISRNAEQDTIQKELIPFYEVNVKNGEQTSFVLVSVDERAPGIMAYFPNWPNTEKDVQKGLSDPNTIAIFAMSKSQLLNDINKIETLKINLREKTIKKICKVLDIPIDAYSYKEVINKLGSSIHKTRSTPTITIPTQVISYKLPMTPLLWDQYPPYNSALPEAKILLPYNNIPDYGHVPVGCSVIAVTLLESIIQRPIINGMSINWSLLRQYPELMKAIPELQQTGSPANVINMATNLIKTIYTALNAFSGTSNGYVTKTYVSNSTVDSYVQNNFLCDSPRSFDPDVVLTSLQQNRPVFLSGNVIGDDGPGTSLYSEGHNFVIDGYVIARKANALYSSIAESRSNIVLNYDMYWHVNLGWGFGSVAYFKLDSDATCTLELNDRYGRYNKINLKDQTIIANIRKK